MNNLTQRHDEKLENIGTKTYFHGYILTIAGVHGNEPGPSYGLMDIIQRGYSDIYSDWPVICTYFTFMPRVNHVALSIGKRHIGEDINRLFGINSKLHLTNIIQYQVRQSTCVIDFHEAWGYHRSNNNSLGQTIYLNRHWVMMYGESGVDIMRKLVAELSVDLVWSKGWDIIFSLPPVTGTLDEYCNLVSKPYILVEMAGQKDIQPLHIRIEATKKIIRAIYNVSKSRR